MLWLQFWALAAGHATALILDGKLDNPDAVLGILAEHGDAWSKCHNWVDDDRLWVQALAHRGQAPCIIRTNELMP